VSRRHALLRRDGAGHRIEDLGSTNGVYVNGLRVRRAELVAGDRLQIGGASFRFDPGTLTHYARGRGVQVDAVGLSRVVGKGMSILHDVSLSA
jgi:pSer/pThr/pTyr-binding forkhead associated (FHA) protein